MSEQFLRALEAQAINTVPSLGFDPFTFLLRMIARIAGLEYAAYAPRAEPFLFTIRYLSAFVSIALVLALVYLVLRYNELARKAKEAERADVEKVSGYKTRSGGQRENLKWKRVLEHVESANPSDWRLAIMEADIMLDEVFSSMGYRGDTLGEKMKQIEKSDFSTIDKAWEGHKIRNVIAHEGQDFQLSQREARRVINLFKEVFEEFRYI